jgi:hypothetical protein
VVTLGETLAREARRLRQQRFPAIGWLGALQATLDRTISRAGVAQFRFSRREAFPRAASMAPQALEVEFDAGQQVPPVAPGLHQARRKPVVADAPRLRRDPRRDQGTGEASVGNAAAAELAPGERDRCHTARGPDTDITTDYQGMPVPAQLREKLHDLVGTGADVARLHHNSRSDALARDHHADAVTVGRDIFFRRGALRPRESAGFALLVHEATHVAEAMRTDAAWRRVTGAGVQEEESLALWRERALLQSARPAPLPLSPGETGGPAQSAWLGRMPQPASLLPWRSTLVRAVAPRAPASSSPVNRPMKADIDRAMPGPIAEGVRLNYDDMRRMLFRDLLVQLRVEFERGA